MLRLPYFVLRAPKIIAEGDQEMTGTGEETSIVSCIER